EIAAVKRELLNHSLVDHMADGCGCPFYSLGRWSNADFLGEVADAKLKVLYDRPPNFDYQAVHNLGLEPLRLNFNTISADRQIRNLVVTLAVGLRDTFQVGCQIAHCDTDAAHYRSGRVHYSAKQNGGRLNTAQGDRDQERADGEHARERTNGWRVRAHRTSARV